MKEGGRYEIIDGKRVLIERTGLQPEFKTEKPKKEVKKDELQK